MIIEINLAPDTYLAELFLDSDIWSECSRNEDYKKKRGLPNAVREWLLSFYNIPEEAGVPLVLEKATGRITFLLRSKWGSKGAETKKRKARVRNKKALAAERKLIKRAKSAIRRFSKLQRKFKRPLLFSEGLAVQHRPPSPNKKPHRKVK